MQVFLFPISLFPEILWVSSTRVLREQQNKYVFPRRIRMTFIETIFTASCNSFQDKRQQIAEHVIWTSSHWEIILIRTLNILLPYSQVLQNSWTQDTAFPWPETKHNMSVSVHLKDSFSGEIIRHYAQEQRGQNGTKYKNLSPHEESNLTRPLEFVPQFSPIGL